MRLLALIRQVLAYDPFTGEGYRKVHARLRREHGVRVSRKRVLRPMRAHDLLAPQRTRGRRKPRPHDGTIVPDAPDVMSGTDITMAYTTEDGRVWLFATIDRRSVDPPHRSRGPLRHAGNPAALLKRATPANSTLRSHASTRTEHSRPDRPAPQRGCY